MAAILPLGAVAVAVAQLEQVEMPLLLGQQGLEGTERFLLFLAYPQPMQVVVAAGMAVAVVRLLELEEQVVVVTALLEVLLPN